MNKQIPLSGSVTEVPIQKDQDVFNKENTEQVSFTGDKSSFKNVFALLNTLGIPYIDNRNVNGALWIIGGKELSDVAKWCESFGLKFTFKADGTRATNGKPGWWTK